MTAENKTIKLKHPNLRKTKTLSSVGQISIDENGVAEVTLDQARLLVTAGFKIHDPEGEAKPKVLPPEPKAADGLPPLTDEVRAKLEEHFGADLSATKKIDEHEPTAAEDAGSEDKGQPSSAEATVAGLMSKYVTPQRPPTPPTPPAVHHHKAPEPSKKSKR